MKVLIDPGHGGKDPGAVGNGLYEKDINLKVSLLLKKNLEKYKDIEVKLSREEDIYLSINERWKMGNEYLPDIFISIHCNAGGGIGTETLYYNNKSMGLAKTIQKEFVNIMKTRDRGIKKRDNIGVLRYSQNKACLIELGFIDTLDFKILKDEEIKMAKALERGILTYFNMDIIMEKRYNSIEEIPDWGKETINKLISKKLLKGDGNLLDLSMDQIRLLLINDRAGLYG